jgi:hypothetical protein
VVHYAKNGPELIETKESRKKKENKDKSRVYFDISIISINSKLVLIIFHCYSLSFSVLFAIHKATADSTASAGTAWEFKFELNPLPFCC